MGNFVFKPIEFVNNLRYMGVGMLGVFMIVGIIMIATYIIGAASGSSKKKNDEESKN